ncbi:MAG: histidine phosphatase family protein [Planctomycetota bacterium]
MTNVTRIHLVRHGVVEARWSGRLYGDLDVELSAEGREQARQAAVRLAAQPLDAVVSSDLARARFGAEQIAEGRELEVRVQPALREISRGAWAGRPIEEVKAENPGALEAWFAAPEHSRPPEGESIHDLRSRVLPALQALADEHRGGELAVVAHGWVIRSTLGWILGLPAVALTRLHIPPATIATIDWHPEHGLDLSGDLGPSLDGPHLGTPNLVGIQMDQLPPSNRGWYRAPTKATS